MSPCASPGFCLGAPAGSKAAVDPKSEPSGCESPWILVAGKADVPARRLVGASSSSTPTSQIGGWGSPPAPLLQPPGSSSAGSRLPPAAADRGGQLGPGLCWVKLGRIVPEGFSRWSEPTACIARASPNAGVPAMLRFAPLGPQLVGHMQRLCPQEGKKAPSSPLPRRGWHACTVWGFLAPLLKSPLDLAGVGTEQPCPGCAPQLRVPAGVARFWGAGRGAASCRFLPETSGNRPGGAVVLLRALFLLLLCMGAGR